MGIKVKIMFQYNPEVNKDKGFRDFETFPDDITFKEIKIKREKNMMIKKEKDTWNREGKIINKLLI